MHAPCKTPVTAIPNPVQAALFFLRMAKSTLLSIKIEIAVVEAVAVALSIYQMVLLKLMLLHNAVIAGAVGCSC